MRIIISSCCALVKYIPAFENNNSCREKRNLMRRGSICQKTLFFLCVSTVVVTYNNTIMIRPIFQQRYHAIIILYPRPNKNTTAMDRFLTRTVSVQRLPQVFSTPGKSCFCHPYSIVLCLEEGDPYRKKKMKNVK